MTRTGQDRRPTLTLKGDDFTPEFRALLNKAAKRAGTTQAAFAADVLAAAARRVLAGDNPHGTPTDNPVPATVQQIEDMRVAVKAAEDKAQAAEEKAGGVQQQLDQLATQVATLAAPRGLWSRIRGS